MLDYYGYLEDDSINIEILDYLAQLRIFHADSAYANIEIAKIEIANALLRALKLPTEPTLPECVEAFQEYKKSNIPAKLRWEVFQRDDFTCKSCGSRSDLAADHIQPEIDGGLTVLENLQTLCRNTKS